jgi:hypothetical protein
VSYVNDEKGMIKATGLAMVLSLKPAVALNIIRVVYQYVNHICEPAHTREGEYAHKPGEEIELTFLAFGFCNSKSS